MTNYNGSWNCTEGVEGYITKGDKNMLTPSDLPQHTVPETAGGN